MKIYSQLLILFTFWINPFSSSGQQTTFASGSFIIDMGVTPQTIENGLRPYGLVYDLVKNYDVPVYWVINPNKLKDGIDFTCNGTGFKGGPFIIAAENRTATINSRISYWQSTGVAGTTATSSFSANVAQKITAVPNWTLDAKSGGIAQKYITNAGIPEQNTNWQDPYMLNNCNDIFVLPHADPAWNSHSPLFHWNLNNRGSIWVSCHAVSVLENMFNPSNPSQQTNFLALNSGGAGSNALVNFKNHKDGSVPYNNNSFPADQVMQFLGAIDNATTNGSESIYLPSLGGGWRPTTKVAVYDPSQADVPNLSAGKAALIAYGRGLGDPNRGWVMYEAGHNHSGGGEHGIAAQRAFLNFSFMATLEKAINLAVSGIQSVMISGNVYALSAVVTQNIPTGPYSVQWTSSCGGTFSSPNSLTTDFTPPAVVDPATCIISVKVTDACGRSRFHTQNILVTSGPRPPVALPDSLYFSPDCTNINQVITINAKANDSDPDGQPITITSVSGNNGTWSINPDQTVKYVPTTGFYGTATATYTVCDNTLPAPLCATGAIAVAIGSASQAPVAVDDSYTIYEDSVQRFHVLANDVQGSGNLKIAGIPVLPKNGKVSINVDNTITYLPNADYYGEDSFHYRIASNGGFYSTGKVMISVKHDCCAPGNYKRILGPIITTTQTLVATQDSYLKLKSPTTNYGTSTTLVLDRETTDKHVGVLKFDLSGLICYATLVRSATMKMQMVSGNVQDVSVYRLLNNWAENQVTWNNRLTGVPWATPGGDLSSLVSMQGTPVSSIYNWNMNAVMQDMVCNSTTFPNHGFEIKVDCSGCGNRLTTFASREDNTAGVLKPSMEVTFDSAAFVCAPIPIRAPLSMPDSAVAYSNSSILINAIANDWLPGSNTGTISIVPGSVTAGTASIINNKINYVPNLHFQGLTSFQYIATDDVTGLTDSATVYVYVTYPAPVANNDTITINSGETGNTDLLTNDIDLVGLGLTTVVISEPVHGTYTKSGSVITYTAPFNFYGRDSLAYKITNVGTGPCNETIVSDTAYLIINVLNRPPVALNNSASTNPCQQITIDVLDNDYDPENGTLTISSVSAVNPVSAGTVSTNGAYIFFVPNPAFLGSSASFTYTINDDAVPPATSNAATVTISLSNIANLPPVAYDDMESGLSNTDIFINVMSNDTDPENDSLSVSLSGAGLVRPANGTATVLPNGLIKYTPIANFVGTDYFDYRLNDHHAGVSGGICTNVSLSDVARVFVIVSNVYVILANDFKNLTGTYADGKSRLGFTINEIKGTAVYVIEKSSDGRNFAKVGQLAKQSEADAGEKIYQYTDQSPAAGNNFYRVKVIRNNEAAFYSNTILLRRQDVSVTLQTFPIPFTSALTVKFDLQKAEKVRICLVSQNGIAIKNMDFNGAKGSNEIPIPNLGTLNPGLYFIKVEINETVLVNKAVKL